jgi:hypothetical protein
MINIREVIVPSDSSALGGESNSGMPVFAYSAIEWNYGIREKIIPILIYLPNFLSLETEDWDSDAPSHALSIVSKRRSYFGRFRTMSAKNRFLGESGRIYPNPHLSPQLFISGKMQIGIQMPHPMSPRLFRNGSPNYSELGHFDRK